MSRKRDRHRRGKRRGGGGVLTSMRGRFKGGVQAVTGTGPKRPTSPARKALGNAVTVALLVMAVVLLLRRFGVFQ
jgi:hypothetical protein